MSVIKVDNLSKKYIISHQRQERYTALRDVITNKAKGLFNRGIVQPLKRLNPNSTISQFNNSTSLPSPNSTTQQSSSSTTEEFWALKDINFEVKRGDRVGIIGRNGAGKSTLLKILSRITEPTSGRIEITGRVASLLEVGTGFHPELTGRENIFLNGAILGMTKAEIKRKFDEIVAFAEIEKFLDTPVKRYSSGMYVRLAFAVAVHLEPEILIVDEVLAVGDAQFQKKCLGKMEEVSRLGRTIMFVSHNMSAVSTLCNKGLVLSGGNIKFEGDTDLAISTYLISGTNSSYERNKFDQNKLPVIQRAWFENVDGKKTTQFYNGEPIYLLIETENPECMSTEIYLSFWDNLRRPLWNFTHAMHGISALPKNKNMRVRIVFYPPKLTISELMVDLAIGHRTGGRYYDHIMNALKCAIIEKSETTVSERFPGWPIFCEVKMTHEAIEC